MFPNIDERRFYVLVLAYVYGPPMIIGVLNNASFVVVCFQYVGNFIISD